MKFTKSQIEEALAKELGIYGAQSIKVKRVSVKSNPWFHYPGEGKYEEPETLEIVVEIQ